MSDYLSHHGIKGQKWGVRNGPPYPIENKLLRKGTRLNSVSGIRKTKDYINKGRALYTYNPNDSWDSDVYKGAFSKYLKIYRNVPVVYDHQFTVVKDLKMPTKQERFNEFTNIIKNRPEIMSELKSMGKRLAQYNIDGYEKAAKYEAFSRGAIDNFKDVDDYKNTAYAIFNHMMESYVSFKSTRDYMQTMASKYDAMVDDNNQGVYNEAHDPIIIFRAKECIEPYKKTKVGKVVTDDEINNRSDRVRTEMKKKGKNLLL